MNMAVALWVVVGFTIGSFAIQKKKQYERETEQSKRAKYSWSAIGYNTYSNF